MLLLETDYTMYAIFYMQNSKSETKTQVLALYGNPICLGIPASGKVSSMGSRHIMEWCLLSQQKVPNLSPGRFSQIDETYQERFEIVCKLYGLGSQNIIDMTNQGRVPFSDSERPREGSLQPGVPCTGALRMAVGGQGGAQQAI